MVASSCSPDILFEDGLHHPVRAGEFFTPPEVARIMARIMDPEPGQSVYDPCCGSAGLLIACEHALDEKVRREGEAPAVRLSSTNS